MSKAALMQDLFLILSIAGAGAVLSLWGLLFFAAGHMRGYKKGVNDRPDRLTEKWREEQFRRKVADDRLESQEQTLATLRMALQQAVQAQPGLKLVDRAGAGR